METRICPRCFRAYPLEYCKAKAKVDKHNKTQKSFTCSCGDVPYRTIERPDKSIVEVTNPRYIVAAKERIKADAAAAVTAAKKVDADLDKLGKVAR